MSRKNQVHAIEYDDYENIFAINTNLNRKQRKKIKRQQNQKTKNKNLKKIEAMTDGQQQAIDSYLSGQHLLLHGMAGTGKTFLSMYLALKDIEEQYENKTRLVIVRSVVPTRDMGFLPGNQKEKTAAYEHPYKAICSELYGRGDAYEILKQKGMIEFISTSFIRGITLDNCVVLVDECQNMNFHELDSIITRVGENVQVIFSGDFRQSDFRWDDEKEGLHDFMRVIKRMKSFNFVEFDKDDIVRSDVVREYIISKLELNMT